MTVLPKPGDGSTSARPPDREPGTREDGEAMPPATIDPRPNGHDEPKPGAAVDRRPLASRRSAPTVKQQLARFGSGS